MCLDGFSFGKLGHFDDGCGSLFQWIAFLAEALELAAAAAAATGRRRRTCGAECVEHEEIFHWRQLREEEAVASGDVDDFVAVAAAAARRSDAL